jgi:integrase
VLADYADKGRRSARRIGIAWAHLVGYFGERTLAKSITATSIKQYTAARQITASAATVNRELCALKRGFRLAVIDKQLSANAPPHIGMLTENDPRKGFFEPEDFAKLLAKLPERVRPLARAGYITGWRVSELLSLT